MSITINNMKQLESMKSLKEGWFGDNHGEPIHENAIRNTQSLLMLLPENFEIFPLSDGYIQAEYETNNKYLEICIKDDEYKIYWAIKRNNQLIAEGEDVYKIINQVPEILCSFLLWFFKA